MINLQECDEEESNLIQKIKEGSKVQRLKQKRDF